MWTVYKATAPDGMVYIGCTSRSLKQRIKSWHPSSKRCLLIPYSNGDLIRSWSDALGKYGKKSIVTEIISTHENIREAASAETQAIKDDDCLWPNGYNQASVSAIYNRNAKRQTPGVA